MSVASEMEQKLASFREDFNALRHEVGKRIVGQEETIDLVLTALVAGGGFKGGRVVGESDAKGERVAERPVYPPDLLGSICELLGISRGTLIAPRHGAVGICSA